MRFANIFLFFSRNIRANLHFSSTCQNRLFGGFFMISKIFSDENA